MKKELLFYNKDFGRQKFSLQQYKVDIYRRIDFNGSTNEMFDQKQFSSENFEAANKFLAKTFKEIKKENLDVLIANRIEIEAQRKKKKRIKDLTNLLGSNREFIEDASKIDLSKILSERIEEIITNYQFANCIYENKVLKICLTQRIAASFKDKKISFPEKYVIWFSAYFENDDLRFRDERVH